MGRKNRKDSKSTYYDEEFLREFENNELMRQLKVDGPKNKDLKLKNIEPLTKNQARVFQEYENGHNLVLYGIAGSGKTFLAFYLALQEVFLQKYHKIIIVRSALPSRDIGFLPGTLEEKIDVYKAPYVHICSKLFETPDAYQRLEKRGYIEFVTTSYLRGMTFDNCIIILDEFENCSFQECDTLITRLGCNSKIILCGDFDQSDIIKERDKNGAKDFMTILSQMDEVKMIQFEIDDIVRSGFIKSYIIHKQQLKLRNAI